MKLTTLVVAAGIFALPAMGHAQATSQDSMKMAADSMKMKASSKHMAVRRKARAEKAEATDSAATARTEKRHARAEKAENSGMAMTSTAAGPLPAMSTNGPRPVPPSDGTTCPWKCPTSKGTAGLTGPQFLALQQELRDKSCGTSHVTGWLDSPTRHAIAVCAKRLGVARNAGAVLVAMNIGYSDADVTPAKM